MEIRFAKGTDVPAILALLKQVGALHHQGRPDIFRSGAIKYTPEQLQALLKDTDKPIFIALVRGCRHTYSMLEKNPEFTVNIPLGSLDKNIIKVTGTKSGRDTDKFQELGLTTEVPEKISVPGICQLPLTLECKVLYKQQQYPEHLLSQEPSKFYQKDPVSIQDDYHTAYYGEIVSAYIIRNP